MDKINIEDIKFYERQRFITIPANPRGTSGKERKRIDLSRLNRERILPGLSHFSGVIDGVFDRQISFWKLSKQKKFKNGEVLRIFLHLDTKQDAIKAYAKFKINPTSLGGAVTPYKRHKR